MPLDHCMPAVSVLQTVYVMVMNTVTDFYLMAIPLPIVWQANLPWKKKAVLLLMFSGGFLEMAFGILRCVSILTVVTHCFFFTGMVILEETSC